MILIKDTGACETSCGEQGRMYDLSAIENGNNCIRAWRDQLHALLHQYHSGAIIMYTDL